MGAVHCRGLPVVAEMPGCENGGALQDGRELLSMPRNAGRKDTPLLCSLCILLPRLHQSQQEQRHAGAEGRIRGQKNQDRRGQLASHRPGEEEGMEREDLISCYKWGGVRMWRAGSERGRFKTPGQRWK